jgi:membrane-bound acyltransferase YfiQ involved in biofilm formation
MAIQVAEGILIAIVVILGVVMLGYGLLRILPKLPDLKPWHVILIFIVITCFAVWGLGWAIVNHLVYGS